MEESFYDTSVIIGAVREGVNELKGYTAILNMIEFPKAIELAGLKVIYPTSRDCDEALKTSIELLHLGRLIPAIDILTASMAILRDLTLVTKDERFHDLKTVRKELRLELRR